MRILICTDGSPHAERAGAFGAHVVRATRAEVVLLGIAESRGAEAKVRAALERLRESIRDEISGVSVKLRSGHAAEQDAAALVSPKKSRSGT